MQRAGPKLVLSGGGRERAGLAAILSRPMGVGSCETETIGYTCRTGALKIFGQGFNSPRLHQTALRAYRWPLFGDSRNGGQRIITSSVPIKHVGLRVPTALHRLVVLHADGPTSPVTHPHLFSWV